MKVWDPKKGQLIDIDVNSDYKSKYYNLSLHPDNLYSGKYMIEEGSSLLVYLTTQNVPEGTLIPYTIKITGKKSEDILNRSDLKGNFSVGAPDSAGYSISVEELEIKEDSLTEGPELMQISLDGLSKYVEVVIIDSSKSQDFTPKYNLSSNASVGSVTEGQEVTFILETENVEDGKVLYSISGISKEDLDDGKLSGHFEIVNDSNGKSISEVKVVLKSDRKSDKNELMIFSVVGTDEKISLNIEDTSKSPTYILSSSSTSIKSGDSIILSIDTTEVDDGEEIFYNILNLDPSEIYIDSQTMLDSMGNLLDSAGSLDLSSKGKMLRGSFIVFNNTSEREINFSNILNTKVVTVFLQTGEKLNLFLKK